MDGQSPGYRGDESPISGRERQFKHVLDSLAAFAQQVSTALQPTNASKVSVQFGCEVVVESGSFIAVIGKASAKSTMTVSLEWTAPTP